VLLKAGAPIRPVYPFVERYRAESTPAKEKFGNFVADVLRRIGERHQCFSGYRAATVQSKGRLVTLVIHDGDAARIDTRIVTDLPQRSE
jgi:hypothetical protein